MPDLFVPESEWAPKSWGVNHPLAVRAHIEHGLDEAGYGYWGFSPASDPFGTYNVYGVDAIGMDPSGYPSDAEKTNVDAGYEGCRPATNPTPTFGDGVVTPHASFLALPYAPREAVDNLRNIETELGAYGAGGFYDSVAVRSTPRRSGTCRSTRAWCWARWATCSAATCCTTRSAPAGGEGPAPAHRPGGVRAGVVE